jgi:hypothetical protein
VRIQKDSKFLNVNISDVAEWELKGWARASEASPQPPAPVLPVEERPAPEPPAPEAPDVAETPSLGKCSIGQLRAIAKDLGLSGHASMKRADALEILGACEADALKALQSLMTNGS